MQENRLRLFSPDVRMPLGLFSPDFRVPLGYPFSPPDFRAAPSGPAPRARPNLGLIPTAWFPRTSPTMTWDNCLIDHVFVAAPAGINWAVSDWVVDVYDYTGVDPYFPSDHRAYVATISF